MREKLEKLSQKRKDSPQMMNKKIDSTLSNNEQISLVPDILNK